MDMQLTRRKLVSVTGLSGIISVAGCLGGNGDADESPSQVINSIETGTAEGSLLVTLATTESIDTLSVSTPEGEEVGTASVDESTTVELSVTGGMQANSYEVAALDADGEIIEQTTWEPPSNIAVESVSVTRPEDFRQLTIEIRNDAGRTITATRAYIESGYPTETLSDGGDPGVGRISDLGGEKELPAGETTEIIMSVDAVNSAGAQGRLLNPSANTCPGENETASRQIEIVLEFDREPTKRLQVDIQFGGENRSFYPFGCEVVNIADWQEV